MTFPATTNDAPGRQRKLDWAGDDAALKKMVKQGVDTDAICERLNRPRSSVLWRKSKLGLCEGPLKQHLGIARAQIASLEREIEKARADEREKCAQIADAMNDGDTAANRRIAVAIRARKDDAP